jgi:hypothetical protein
LRLNLKKILRFPKRSLRGSREVYKSSRGLIFYYYIELKRLGWTSEQGRNYLLQTYGKRSRFMLTDKEILNFLDYLKNLPTSKGEESNTVKTQLDFLKNINNTDAIPF